MDDILLRALDLSERLVAARTSHRAAEHTLVLLLTELCTDQLFRPLGYRSIEEFAAVKLDLTARQTRDLVRIGRALPGLPLLDATMKAGALDWTKVREVARIATPETEADWIARAKSVSPRVLEREVAAAAPGACPSDEGVRAEPLRALHVRGESADIETIHAALSAFRARTGASVEEIEDGAALAAICRRYLADLDEGDDRPPTAERYKIIVEHCPGCGDTHLPDADIGPTIADEARCDAEVLEMRPGPKQGHVSRTIPPSVRQIVLARAKWRCEVPGCLNRLWLDIHHTHHRVDGGDHDPERLVCLCDGHHRASHSGYFHVDRKQDGSIVVVRADGSAARRRRVRTHVGRAQPPQTMAEADNGGAIRVGVRPIRGERASPVGGG